MADDKQETETELLRRSMTPFTLLFLRGFIGVGVPFFMTLKTGIKLLAAKGDVGVSDWMDVIIDAIISGATAMGAFMDRIWGRWMDERKNGKQQ